MGYLVLELWFMAGATQYIREAAWSRRDAANSALSIARRGTICHAPPLCIVRNPLRHSKQSLSRSVYPRDPSLRYSGHPFFFTSRCCRPRELLRSRVELGCCVKRVIHDGASRSGPSHRGRSSDLLKSRRKSNFLLWQSIRCRIN